MSAPVARLALGHVPARLPRPRLAVVVAFMLALFAPSRSEAGQVPRYGELPVGTVTAPTNGSKPASIPARESVPGIVVTAGPSTETIVSSSDGAAKSSGVGTVGTTCFSQPLPPSLTASGVVGIAQRPHEWEGALSAQGTIWPAPHGPNVTQVHVERVVEREGMFSLESTDILVDSVTRGARLVARAALPLRHVGTVPGGVKLFAGRDERPDGKRYLQFIVSRSAGLPLNQFTSVVGMRGPAMLPGSTCAHARVALVPDKPGETASLQFSTILPALPPGELSLAPPQPSPPSPAGGPLANEVRVRPLHIHVSVSQTTRDREPVFAVSEAWAGPEHKQRFDPPPMPSAHVSKAATVDPGF